MWNKPTDKDLNSIPPLYTAEEVLGKEKIIYMHFFIGGCDWYGAEFSPEEGTFFGFVILNNDFEMAEWGYFSLSELEEINVRGIEIDRDISWTPRKAADVGRIKEANSW